jgi:hypothetical protein
VDSVSLKDIEDLINDKKNQTVAYCRCWRSKQVSPCFHPLSGGVGETPAFIA